MRYLTAYQVLVIHKRIIDVTSGSHGLRDAGLLDSAVHRPRASFGGEDFYPTVFDKAAALFHSIAMNHVFIDGNKRTAFVSADMFLKINRYQIVATNNEVVKFTLKIVEQKLDVPEISKWLKQRAKRQ